MTALGTDVRNDLATAMTACGVPVITPAPAAPTPPCVVITHGAPWMTPATLPRSVDMGMRVMCVTRSGKDHLPQLEQMVEDALNAVPDGWSIDTVTAPADLDTGAQGVVTVAEINLSATFALPAPPT